MWQNWMKWILPMWAWPDDQKRLLHIYFTRKAIYVPTMAKYSNGAWTEWNPVERCDGDDWAGFADIIARSFSAGRPKIYATPWTRFSYPPWVMLAATKKRYPKQISRIALLGSIEKSKEGWRLTISRADSRNYWIEIDEETINLPPDSGIAAVIAYFKDRAPRLRDDGLPPK